MIAGNGATKLGSSEPPSHLLLPELPPAVAATEEEKRPLLEVQQLLN